MEGAGIPRRELLTRQREGRIDVHWRRSTRSDPDHHHPDSDLEMRDDLALPCSAFKLMGLDGLDYGRFPGEGPAG
jgi:hypothetical protein